MYNINSISYTEDRRSLYIAASIASLSLISFSEPSVNMDYIAEKVTIELNEVNEEESSLELTQHAMNLTQESLSEDWNNEDDDHWSSFL